MRRYLQLALVALAFAAPIFAQQLTRTSLSNSHIVARVNGVSLFQKDLDAQMQALFPYYSVHGGQVPASAQPEIRQKAMDRLLLDELMYQEARRRGITATAAEVSGRIAAARKKTDSKAEFDQAVAHAYGTMSNFRIRAARALMIEKLWTAQVMRPSRPTDADLLKFYRENKAKFQRPEAVQLQTISFLFAQNATPAQQDEVKKKAEAILAKAQSSKTVDEFGAIAEKSSEDDWRVMNGDHGWVHRGTVEPELESAFGMKTGQVSGVIRSRVGYHILRVNGYQAAQQLSYAQVKKDLRTTLEKQREQKLRSALETSLRSKARIEYQ